MRPTGNEAGSSLSVVNRKREQRLRIDDVTLLNTAALTFVRAARPSNPATTLIEYKRPLKIFKFGGSILQDPKDLARIAGEIYRETRFQERVIAVVSAFEGETDALLGACQAITGDTACCGVPDAVSLGEEKVAALLRIACDRIGVEAVTVRPEQFGILTQGQALEADPIGLNGSLEEAFGDARVLILPGFVGIDKESNCRSLLGRGGTDFSAIFLAGELDADLVRLYKDVDGVFDHDPAADPNDLHRFDEVGWDDCLTLARPLLQPRAVEYARSKELELEVGAIGSPRPTRVAAESRPPKSPEPGPKLRIALAGYGTVGQALAERLSREDRFEITSILVRDAAKLRDVPPPVQPTDDALAFQQSEHDVLVEVTSSPITGFRLSILALANGKGVVSANKVVVGKQLYEIEETAAHRGGRLLYSAAVGGSTPALETARFAYSQSEVVSVKAILNGTVNYLLDAISKGATYQQALKQAQVAGFAEEDPSQDLSGRDAELKLRIIAAQIAGPVARAEIEVQALEPEQLEEIARSGERWVQLSSLKWTRTRIWGSVRIVRASELGDIVPPSHERNLISVTTADGRRWEARGRGAGGAATAEAITADLYDLLNVRDCAAKEETERSTASSNSRGPHA